MSNTRKELNLTQTNDANQAPEFFSDPDLSIRVGLILSKDNSFIEGEPLYRGDARHFKDIFNKGFTAHGTNTDLLLHASPPNGFSFSQSAYISTSISRDTAKLFPLSLSTEITPSYVYEIHTKKPIINVVDVLNKINYSPIELEILKSEQERAIPLKIEPNEIKGAWEVESKQRIILDSQEKYKVRTIKGEFIPNLNYISPNYSGQKFWNSSRSFGHLLAGVGLALDGMSLYGEYQHSKESGDYSNTYRESVRIMGGWTNAWAVGTSFSEMGIAGCAPIAPPFGSVACGIFGGLLGSAIGYYSGSMLATRIYDINRSNYAAPNRDSINPVPLPLVLNQTVVQPISIESESTSTSPDDLFEENEVKTKGNNLNFEERNSTIERIEQFFQEEITFKTQAQIFNSINNAKTREWFSVIFGPDRWQQCLATAEYHRDYHIGAGPETWASQLCAISALLVYLKNDEKMSKEDLQQFINTETNLLIDIAKSKLIKVALEDDIKQLNDYDKQLEQIDDEEKKLIEQFQKAQEEALNKQMADCKTEVDAAIARFSAYAETRKVAIAEYATYNLKKAKEKADFFQTEVTNFNNVQLPAIYKKHGFEQNTVNLSSPALKALEEKFNSFKATKLQLISDAQKKYATYSENQRQLQELKSRDDARRASADLERQRQQQQAMESVRKSSEALKKQKEHMDSERIKQQENQRKIEESRRQQKKQHEEFIKKQEEQKRKLDEDRIKQLDKDRKQREEQRKAEDQARRRRMEEATKKSNLSQNSSGMFGSRNNGSTISSNSVTHTTPSRILGNGCPSTHPFKSANNKCVNIGFTPRK